MNYLLVQICSVEILFPSTDDESDRIILYVPSTHEKEERRPQSRNLANSCYVLREQSFFAAYI